MRPILFDKDVSNFDNNGLGVLYQALRCDVLEENNGAFSVELEYPTDGEMFNDLKEGRIILAKPNDIDEPHAFRIYEIEKDLDNEVIYARGTTIIDDLRGNLIKDKLTIKDANPQQALNLIKQNLIEPTIFDFISDMNVPNSAEWTRINPLLAIAGEDASLIKIWGGEIKRTNDTLYVYSRRGKDKVTVVRPGKNIDGFNMIVSEKGIITKVLPTYIYQPINIPKYEMVQQYDGTFKKEEAKREEETTKPEDIVVTGDVVLSPHVDNYAVNYYANIDYSNDDVINELVDTFVETKLNELETSATIIDSSGLQEEIRLYILSLLNTEAAKYFTNNPGIDTPSVEFKADMFQLSDSPEWERYKELERIGVADTIDIYIKKFDVDIEMTIKSINYDSIGERVIDIVAGTSRTSITQSAYKKYVDKAKELEKYIETVENGIYNSISRTADGQSRRFSGYTMPSNDISRNGDLWFREVGNGVVETYIYNGGAWIPIISEIKVAEMERAIADAKLLAENAAKKAQGTIDDINNVLVGEGFTTLADLFASKISTEDYGTLFFQEAESIGLVYNEDGVDKAIIMISEGMPYIKGEHIILNGNTIVDGTFTVTDTMLADSAVINSLVATGIDAQNVRIVNLDANSITGGDLELSKGLRITNNGFPVLEVDAVTGQVRIQAANLATKEDLENIEVNVDLGGRNLLKNSRMIELSDTDDAATRTSDFDETLMIGTITVGDVSINELSVYGWLTDYLVDPELAGYHNQYFTLSVDVKTSTDKFGLGIDFRSPTHTNILVSPITNIPNTKGEWVRVGATIFVPDDGLVRGDLLAFFEDNGLVTGDVLQYKNWSYESGNVFGEWIAAPEDIQAVIDEKAATTDLENLGQIVSSVSSLVNSKAGMGEFQAMQEAFNARVEQDIVDKEQLTADLATIEGRTTLIETLAGENKLVTEFIETVISQSEEGIFIANGSSSTGILISDNRISFMDNDVEVAYISNKTMQISHGIFVESATISDFKFEKIPGTTILAITWVGE